MKKINIILILCFVLLFLSVSKVGAFSTSDTEGEINNDLVYQEDLPYLMNIQFEAPNTYGLLNLNINSFNMNYDLYSRLVGLEYMPPVTNASGILETSDIDEIIEAAPGTYYQIALYNEYRDTFETITYIPVRFPSDTVVKVDYYFNNVFTTFSGDLWGPNFIIASDDNWSTSLNYIQDYILVTDKNASVNGTTKANENITTSQYDFETSYRPFTTFDNDNSEFKTLKVSYRFKVSKNTFGGLVIRNSTHMTKYPHYISDFTVVEQANVDFNGWIISIFSAFNSLFALRLGNVTLGSILLIPLILSVVFVVIRLWRGGAE